MIAADRVDMTDKTDMNNCKHYSADKLNCKKIKALETDCMNRKNNYHWNCYLDDEAGSAA